MLGAEHIDHVAIPVRDLPKAEVFYLDWLGLKLKTRRKNLDGSPRQSYVLAGENIIGLHLPGVTAEASPSTAPRVGIAVTAERFAAILKRLDQAGHAYTVAEREQIPPPVLESASFLDSDGNWVEIGVWRDPSSPEYLSQIVVETLDVEKTKNFYMNVLGMKAIGRFGEEHFLELQSGQFYGLRPVATLSERSRRHGRGCHIALNVSHEEFDEMLQLIPAYGGQNQGDPRADDGLRPEGEKSTYFFDPDKNRLQITAAAESEMLSDQEKWQRIVDNRAKQGRALSRWDRGESTKSQK
jgi:catechol 2,3-dioxygenase-like lactoylglutathione lyase family enzyme